MAGQVPGYTGKMLHSSRSAAGGLGARDFILDGESRDYQRLGIAQCTGVNFLELDSGCGVWR